jgi:D-arginine dehydrogenase
MAAQHCDVLVIGAGIAGASVAANLARSLKIILLERESQPGYHSTGRSAALFSEIYGNPVVRALSRASRDFLFAPPKGFAEYALATSRGSLHIAREDQRAALDEFLGEPDVAANAHWVDRDECRKRCPLLKPDYAAAGAFEPHARDIDVHGLHQGFLRMVRAGGGALVPDAPCQAIERSTSAWRVRAGEHTFEAPIIVNAAGAWADEIASMAGVAPIGITPCRRTAMLVDGPPGADIDAMPLVIDMGEEFYFKPDAGKLLLSPADETPSPPCDIQPDEFDIALAIDRVQSATTLEIKRVSRKWAGLRSFAPDRSLVIGFDPAAEGFFWLAGQGGYGIQTSPAAGRAAAALIRRDPVPDDIAGFGVSAEALSPRRFSAR